MKPSAPALLVLLSCASCGSGDPARSILPRWTYEDTVPLAPPGAGTDGRIVVARAQAPGRFETRDAVDGPNLEGPFDTLPTAHAPFMVADNVFLIAQVSGRVVRLDLAGQERDMPALALGTTGPMVAAPDGGLRIPSNAGTLAIVPPTYDAVVHANLPGATDTPPAVRSDGVTFVATDTGDVVGIDAGGQTVFQQSVAAPASGVDANADFVAVGALDGLEIFDAAGERVGKHVTDARVVGARFAADGDVIAWSEGGDLFKISTDGQMRFALELGAPIYAEVHELPKGDFAVVDANGKGWLISADGLTLDTVDIAPEEGGAPLRQVARGPNSEIYVTRGTKVVGFDFGFEL